VDYEPSACPTSPAIIPSYDSHFQILVNCRSNYFSPVRNFPLAKMSSFAGLRPLRNLPRGINRSRHKDQIPPFSIHQSGDRRPILPTMITDTEPRAVPKPPCNCGCKGDKSKLVAANVPSSPEFNKRVDDQVRALLEKASQLRVNGRTWYLTS
jgi:hypothetical protein